MHALCTYLSKNLEIWTKYTTFELNIIDNPATAVMWLAEIDQFAKDVSDYSMTTVWFVAKTHQLSLLPQNMAYRPSTPYPICHLSYQQFLHVWTFWRHAHPVNIFIFMVPDIFHQCGLVGLIFQIWTQGIHTETSSPSHKPWKIDYLLSYLIE